MAKDVTICVGTIGIGLWRSPDGGDTWGRVGSSLAAESRVYGVAVHPKDPKVIFVGAHDGLHRSDNRGQSFEHIDSPMNSMDVWKIAFDPINPDTMFVGTRPANVYRSKDAGQHWELLETDMVDDCPNVGVPRITALTVDPLDPRNVWAGVEVDGVRRSLDGGDTWSRIGGGLNDPDIHDIAVSVGDPKTVITCTPGEIFTSTDTGEAWQGLGVRDSFPLPYCRNMALKPGDPNVIFVATGDGPAGSTGTIQRSTDRGKTWENLSLPVVPNAPMWTFATHPADPDLIMSCSHYGQIFASSDGGDWWTKLRREFSETRAMAWTPN
jgi:photosystem II stability/assembly factor-like uncharacterized protein